jgi:hypothetical protein
MGHLFEQAQVVFGLPPGNRSRIMAFDPEPASLAVKRPVGIIGHKQGIEPKRYHVLVWQGERSGIQRPMALVDFTRE